ncbi:hypothetical protein J3B02_005718 [Coemansia erecta]|nr:hypothetical protein J3B02_005718 [Coemansia erecta]
MMRRQQQQRQSGSGSNLANARSSIASPPFTAAGGSSGQIPTTTSSSSSSSIRRLPSNNRLRHVASSNTLRNNGYGYQRPAYGNKTFAESSDSDEHIPTSSRSLVPSGSNSSLYGRSKRVGVQGMFKPDDEFLTLRPVHTPDIVPRTIDPSLVERAMTPMLKTNAGILHSSIADMLRNSSSIDMHASIAGMTMAANFTDDSDIEDHHNDDEEVFSPQKSMQSPKTTVNTLPPLPPLPETSPAEAQNCQSHMSPLASPQGSPVIESDASAKTPSRSSFSGRFGRPSFLTRSKAKSASSGSMVSGIPLPSFSSFMSSSSKISTPKQAPATARDSLSGKSDTSSVRKARSLWTLRSSNSK